MGSKYLDIGLALFMGFFAYTRYENGQYAFAILFAVLALFNVVMAVLKQKTSTKIMRHKKISGKESTTTVSLLEIFN